MKDFTKSRALRILVLCLLVGAQTGLLAHEISHFDSNEDHVLCEVCTVGQGLDSAAAAEQACLPPQTAATAPAWLETRAHVSNVSIHFAPRAPPLNTSSDH